MIKFNESNSFFDGKEIILTLNDICLELKHNDIEYEIQPALTDEIKLKLLGIHLKGSPRRVNFEVTIKATEKINVGKSLSNSGDNFLKGFDKSKDIVKSVIQQIESYIKTEGFKCEYEYDYNLIFYTGQEVGDTSNKMKSDNFDEKYFNTTSAGSANSLRYSKEYKSNPCRKIKIIFTK